MSKKTYNRKTCLPASFFAGDTVQVARALIGQILVVSGDVKKRAFRIIETEAYTQEDAACHAFRGPTARTAVMFEEPGYSYVYFIYGMYHCLNVVTEARGRGCAVLFRGLESLDESETVDLSGPGKICRHLQIDTSMNNLPLFDHRSPISIHQGVMHGSIIQGPRVGISKNTEVEWRFRLQN